VADKSEINMSRDDFDAVVSGASSAGLFAAEKLAKSGRKVVLFERKNSPQEPQRTWIVTDRFRSILGDPPSDVIVHETGVMRINAGDSSASIILQPPDLIVERTALLRHLTSRAIEAGVEIRKNSEVADFSFEKNGISLSIEGRNSKVSHKVRTRDLILASGTNCQITRSLSDVPQKVIPIVQAVVNLPEGYDPNVTEVWFDRDSTTYFYWLIPDSPSTGVLGFVGESPARARDEIHDFLRKGGFQPLSYQGAMIPLHQPLRRLEWRSSGSRVLLVGDAAAHVKVTTVGGVVSGLWGAEAAARSILRKTSYQRELRSLNMELYLHDLIRWSMDRFDQHMYEELVCMMNSSLRGFLGRRNRDSMAGGILELIARQPRVIRLGLRSLFMPYRGVGSSLLKKDARFAKRVEEI
jgi:digeranylgeranylglycerophospholipid reductase